MCGKVAGQLKLVSCWDCCRRVICHIRVTDMWGESWGGEYVHTFARPWLYAVHNRDWAIDLVEHFRTCCDRNKSRWQSKWCGWGPRYWCGWWEWKPRIAERIGHPLCGWCYDWHNSDYTDNRPYRPHLVERTAHRLDRLLPRTAGGTQMPFSVEWNIAEYLVSMWEP